MPPSVRPPDRVLPHPGRHLAFDPAGLLVVCGGWPGRLTIFDVASGRIVLEKKRRTLANFLSIAPDGSRLYTGEKTASGYTLPRLTRAPSLKGHRRGINDVAFSSDSAWSASVSGQHVIPPDNTLRIWAADGLEVVRMKLEGYGQQAIFLDDDRVFVRTTSPRLSLIRLSDETEVWAVTPPGKHRKIGPMVLSLDRSRLYAFFDQIRDTGSAGFQVLDPTTGTVLHDWFTAPPWKFGHCKGAAIHPTTGHLFASLGDNSGDKATAHITVRQLDPTSGEWLASFGSTRKQSGAVAISPDGAWLAANIGPGIAVWGL
ncbi:MAG: WD40 repeat protein [Myxococcota bacterium]|jgi:WD40 repeat protein